jgi:hydroxyethylthiazole kinase-like sugar kinase family protein
MNHDLKFISNPLEGIIPISASVLYNVGTLTFKVYDIMTLAITQHNKTSG